MTTAFEHVKDQLLLNMSDIPWFVDGGEGGLVVMIVAGKVFMQCKRLAVQQLAVHYHESHQCLCTEVERQP